MSDIPADQPDLEPQGEAPTGEATVADTEQPDTAPPEPIDYLDIDDDLGNKHVRVKVDGEELSVPLREALQGYQRQEDYTRKTMSLADRERQAQEAEQVYEALKANPGMTVQILAQRAGVSVEDYLGMSPAQRDRATQENSDEDLYTDPLERALAEERAAREALEQRILQREADEELRGIVNGLKQEYGASDDDVRATVRQAMQMGLPPQALPMVYQSMAFQKMRVQQDTRREVEGTRAAQDQQRQAAAAAASQAIGSGQSANGVTSTPASQQYGSYREAIEAAFSEHGNPQFS